MKSSKHTYALMLLLILNNFRTFMALIRGPKGKCSCPICYVPSNKTFDLSKSYDLRTVENTKDALDIKQYSSLSEREEKLKELGIRPVEVLT